MLDRLPAGNLAGLALLMLSACTTSDGAGPAPGTDGSAGVGGDAGGAAAASTGGAGGGAVRDAGGSDAGLPRGLPDAALDAAGDAAGLLADATTACYASCAKQIADCPTIDEAACHGVCDYAIATMASRAGCLQLGIASWTCDTTQAWKCDPSQQAVGIPVDSQTCASEVAALNASGCQ